MRLARSLVLAGALTLGLAATTIGIQKLKEYKFNGLRQDFPIYIADFERKYGKFEGSPELEFAGLPPGELGDVIGKNEGNRIIIDNSTWYYLFGRRKDDVVKHELGHRVAEKIIKETNAGWMHFEDDKIIVRDGMGFEAYILSQGFAEYVAIENGAALSRDHYVPFMFVKPVLHYFGVKDGIKVALHNPPTEEEIYYPPAYYQRLGISFANFPVR